MENQMSDQTFSAPVQLGGCHDTHKNCQIDHQTVQTYHLCKDCEVFSTSLNGHALLALIYTGHWSRESLYLAR